MNSATKTLDAFDRQEVAWLKASVAKAKHIKFIAEGIKCHAFSATSAMDANTRNCEYKMVLELAELLKMISDEDIRIGEEQLNPIKSI